MATDIAAKLSAAVSVEGYPPLGQPVAVNIKPILESVAGKLTEEQIDRWFVQFHELNEGRGFDLEMTAEGELIISPMVNMDGAFAEAETTTDVTLWARQNGGRVPSSRGIVRLPDGTRVEPDVAWLSPSQMAELGPIAAGKSITVCPAFVAEIMSGTDTLRPLQRKMERYIANGAQLGWLIDPYRRQAHIYRAGEAVEILDDPENISGDPVMPGFVFEIRRRIFALYETANG